MKRLLIKSGQGDYEVEFHDDLSALIELLKQTPKAVLLVDQKVAKLYSMQLSALAGSMPTLLLSATEEEKTLDGVTRALTFLQQHDCNKQSVIIAVGGGIIQDIV